MLAWCDKSSKLSGIVLSSEEFGRPLFKTYCRMWAGFGCNPSPPEPRGVQQRQDLQLWAILLLWEAARIVPLIPDTSYVFRTEQSDFLLRSSVAFFLTVPSWKSKKVSIGLTFLCENEENGLIFSSGVLLKHVPAAPHTVSWITNHKYTRCVFFWVPIYDNSMQMWIWNQIINSA